MVNIPTTPNGSTDIYDNAPQGRPSTAAFSRRHARKGKPSLWGRDWPATANIETENVWWTDSDEASAIDVNDLPPLTNRKVVTRKGILKKAAKCTQSYRGGAAPSRQSQVPGLTGHPTRLSNRKAPLNFAFANDGHTHHRDRKKPPHSNSKDGKAARLTGEKLHRQADDTWSGANEYEYENADHQVNSRNGQEIKAEDDRIDAALRQAQSNAKRNSKSPSSTPSQQRFFVDDRNDAGRSKQKISRKDREPAVMFRQSFAHAEEPCLIMRNQADLASARESNPRRYSATSPRSYATGSRRDSNYEGKDRFRGKYYQSGYKSERFSENEGYASDSSL